MASSQPLRVNNYEDQYTIQILSDDINGLGVDDVDVDFSMKYNMKTDREIGDVIEHNWIERRQQNPHIFDGSKFRVHDISKIDTKRPLFHLGLTSYREYLGTNCSDQLASELRARGRSEHENPQIYLSDPLGVGAFVLTTDNKFVLLRRSHLCSEAQGLLDGPGGHAEPHMVSGLSEKPEVTRSTCEAIKNEIFDSITREIVDEVNISRCFLSEPRLLGVVYNHTTAWRCSFQFIVKCQLKSHQILKNFETGGHLEANESTECVFVDEQSAMATSSEWWKQLAPASKGAYAIYRQLKKLKK